MFVFLGSIIICPLYKLTLSEQIQVTIKPMAYPEIFFGGEGGFNKFIQLRAEDRENGDLEAAVIWYKKFHFI
jgi:hypothetical protein